MIQKAFGDDAMSAVQIKCLKMVEDLLKVIHFLEGLPQQNTLRLLNVCGLQSTEISVWQCEN